MHNSVFNWVQRQVLHYGLENANVLEIGSYNENGSIRSLFHGEYIGVDMREGPGVDKVANASALPFPFCQFDVVVSVEMLEHDRTFWLSMQEMGRVLKPGGYLLITARGNGFPIHAYPHDYWRFMPESFYELLLLGGTTPIVVEEDSQPDHPGVFGLGRKV